MAMALRQVPHVEKLVVVDSAPVSARMSSEFSTYIDAMKKIEQTGVVRQSKADDVMKDYVPVGFFLLINLFTFLYLIKCSF